MIKLPLTILGYVHGLVRWEKCGGGDIWVGLSSFFFWQKPITWPLDGKSYIVTHLQKKSRFGFLIVWPFCIHAWLTFRYQKKTEEGAWIPGSECVLYWRSGPYRFDAGDSKYIGPWEWYGPGLHLD